MLASLIELLVSHTEVWNLFSRREPSLRAECSVKAERERKRMVWLAGEQVQDINPVQWEETHPAEEPHSSWVSLVLGKRVILLFVSKSWKSPFIRCTGLCPHLTCQPSHRQQRWSTISIFSSPGISAFHSRLVMAKTPICWLPFRKPITWKNSRNAIAHLKNPNTDIKCSASSPLDTQNALGTQEGSQKDKSCTSGHYTLEGCTTLLL